METPLGSFELKVEIVIRSAGEKTNPDQKDIRTGRRLGGGELDEKGGGVWLSNECGRSYEGYF